jgi:reductive dehalogenase
MSKFHSTVSRRDFMKGLGLAGAGIGAAAATSPVFHDLDEVMGAPQGETKHPWYVKELEHEHPTVEIDWSIYQRIDKTAKSPRPLIIRNRDTHAKYSETLADTLAARAAGHEIDYLKEHFPDYQGVSLRDHALTRALYTTRVDYPNWDGGILVHRGSKTGEPAEIPTPESVVNSRQRINGFSKWQGTPEENLRTLRSALRFFGAVEIGCAELTANTRKLIYANSGSETKAGKAYVFKDTDAPEETSTERIIPNKCKYVLFIAGLEPTDVVRHAPAPSGTGYENYSRVATRANYFLGALGYLHVDAGSITTSNSWGTLTGVTEHSRASDVGTAYKYGNMLRMMHRIITDMPLALTHPYDAGIAKFCETCKTCAEMTPWSGCLPLGDKSWQHEDPESESLGNYVPGYKGWRVNYLKCMQCKNCHATCPFNSGDQALIHSVVRATAATVPLLNGFMADMHRTFGYGIRNPEDWWEHDVPTGMWDPAYIKA